MRVCPTKSGVCKELHPVAELKGKMKPIAQLRDKMFFSIVIWGPVRPRSGFFGQGDRRTLTAVQSLWWPRYAGARPAYLLQCSKLAKGIWTATRARVLMLGMKYGARRPSFRRRIAARTSWKRYVRHSLGLKAPRGYGWLTNPKKAAYNRIYNRTTFDLLQRRRLNRRIPLGPTAGIAFLISLAFFIYVFAKLFGR
jgi:hypothetical protein